MTLEEFRATFEPTVFIRVGEGIPRKVSDLGPDKGSGSRTEFNFCDGKILSVFFCSFFANTGNPELKMHTLSE